MRGYLAKGQMAGAAAVWLLAAAGVAAGREPFCSWLYHFAWWPLVLFLDGVLILLKGESWLWQRPREFARLAFWSVSVWLVFEAYNLRLNNWGYVGVEPRVWLRWPGYALAFATVLPGVLLTARVLEALGAWSRVSSPESRVLSSESEVQSPKSKVSNLEFGSWDLTGWQSLSLIIGIIMLWLPLVWPRYAFPLIWITFILLLDPWCDLLVGDSLLRRWWGGERQHHLCLLTAGLLTGVWWELWNYPARARWVYTIPLFNFGKIFEMPVLGYLGFLPFALECAVMYKFLLALEERVFTSVKQRRMVYVIQVVLWVMMFAALDARTVISYD